MDSPTGNTQKMFKRQTQSTSTDTPQPKRLKTTPTSAQLEARQEVRSEKVWVRVKKPNRISVRCPVSEDTSASELISMTVKELLESGCGSVENPLLLDTKDDYGGIMEGE